MCSFTTTNVGVNAYTSLGAQGWSAAPGCPRYHPSAAPAKKEKFLVEEVSVAEEKVSPRAYVKETKAPREPRHLPAQLRSFEHHGGPHGCIRSLLKRVLHPIPSSLAGWRPEGKETWMKPLMASRLANLP
ncbi:hypothetical protein MRX96_040605 [Rhipicephalus microplus]